MVDVVQSCDLEFDSRSVIIKLLWLAPSRFVIPEHGNLILS